MVTREQCVVQSSQDFIADGLVARGYGDDLVHVRDAFPSVTERATELTQTNVALGFTFDDGGTRIELGSDLTLRTYTVEFWVFGLTPEEGENVSSVIRIIAESEGMIPLKDISDPTKPVVDQLLLAGNRPVVVSRQIAHDPANWDRFVWTTTVKLEDIYTPSLVF